MGRMAEMPFAPLFFPQRPCDKRAKWASRRLDRTCLCEHFELSNENGDARITGSKNTQAERARPQRSGVGPAEIITVDSGSLAGSGSFCWDARFAHPDL